MTVLSVVQTARELRERFNPNEIQQLIQELVSIETDVAVSKIPGSTGTRLKPKRVALAGECMHSSLYAPMNPALWSTLPDELLQLVFARLPLPKINELESLSKQWQHRFSSKDPEFMQACSESSPRIFAMITEGLKIGRFSVRLFDTKANRWYSFIQAMEETPIATMCAGDGGLVCCVSTFIRRKDKYPLMITVFNPLTREWRDLPPHVLNDLQPRMLQLLMDEDTKFYKVILVGEKERCEGHATSMTAEIYCSKTEVWSSAEAFPDIIVGCLYRWKSKYHDVLKGTYACLDERACLGPGAYDCAGQQLHEFDVESNPGHQLHEFDVESNPFREIFVESYALVKDHLFVLLHQVPYRGLHQYGLSEYQYQVQNCQPNWVKLRNHNCEEFKFVPSRVRYDVKLYGCKDFLLLELYGFEHKPTWLYDLSTTKWQEVPAVPDSGRVQLPGCGDSDAMFELRWDAAP